MRLMEFYLICILVTASWKTISGETSHKIGPFVLGEVIRDLLIPDLSKNWNSKFTLGRRLLQEDGADVKDIRESIEERSVLKEVDDTETSKESKIKELKAKEPEKKAQQSQEVAKDVTLADEERLDEEKKSERTADVIVDRHGNRRAEAKSQEIGKPSQKQGDVKDKDRVDEVKIDFLKKGSGNEMLDNRTSALESTESTSKEAVAKGNQAKKEENTNVEVNEERMDAETKKGTEAKPKEDQIEETNEEQSATAIRDPDAQGKKETSVEEKEEKKVKLQQKEDHKVAKSEGGEKGETADEGKIQQKLATEFGTNLAGKNVVGDDKQIGGATEEKKANQKQEIKSEKGKLGNKLEQGNNTEGDEVLQKLSETEGKETLSEISGGKPGSTVEDLKLVQEREVKGQDNDVEQAKEDKKKLEEGKKGREERKTESDFSQLKEEASERDKDVKEEVESQVEDVKEDTPSDTVDLDVTSVGGTLSRQSRDPDDEEYGDLVQGFADLPFKFQGTAEKVAEHLAPDLLKLTDTSKIYFNMANQHIAESFSPLIGKDYAPFFASVISYALLLLPLFVVVILFEHIRALLSLQKILLFINIYLAAYFATLLLTSFVIGSEPMVFFYKNSLSSYIYLQLLQAFGYLVYLILQTFNIISSCSSDTFSAKLTSVLQWVVAVLVGLHYYVTIFQRAMATKPPRSSWKVYGIYALSFFILCLFARIKRLKKQYVHAVDGATNKKN